jgi:hypothetical protein
VFRLATCAESAIWRGVAVQLSSSFSV